jgi:hypothetical protein
MQVVIIAALYSRFALGGKRSGRVTGSLSGSPGEYVNMRRLYGQ